MDETLVPLTSLLGLCLGQLIDERSIKSFHHLITLQMIGAGPGFLNSQQLANVSIHHPKNTQTTISKKSLQSVNYLSIHPCMQRKAEWGGFELGWRKCNTPVSDSKHRIGPSLWPPHCYHIHPSDHDWMQLEITPTCVYMCTHTHTHTNTCARMHTHTHTKPVPLISPVTDTSLRRTKSHLFPTRMIGVWWAGRRWRRAIRSSEACRKEDRSVIEYTSRYASPVCIHWS